VRWSPDPEWAPARGWWEGRGGGGRRCGGGGRGRRRAEEPKGPPLGTATLFIVSFNIGIIAICDPETLLY
jgi:hypothetical protein